MNTSPTLGSQLHAYFENHLLCQKGLQPASIKSYRDSIRLFLQFVATEKHSKLTRLKCVDFTCEHVLAFLRHLEKERGNSVATRNQRLAALRSFFEYLADRIPEILMEAQRVAAVLIKRTVPPRTLFIEKDEFEALFNSMPLKMPSALRTVHYYYFFTIQELGHKSLQIYALAVLIMARNRASIYMGKVTNGEFVLCGRKLQIC